MYYSYLGTVMNNLSRHLSNPSGRLLEATNFPELIASCFASCEGQSYSTSRHLNFSFSLTASTVETLATIAAASKQNVTIGSSFDLIVVHFTFRYFRPRCSIFHKCTPQATTAQFQPLIQIKFTIHSPALHKISDQVSTNFFPAPGQLVFRPKRSR